MAEPVDPDNAIALRREPDFPPARLSVFEDPADWKSAHGTQRYSALSRFYADRQPSWYESTTREFAGLDRVLDLGCGPGLALAALAAHGVREPIGIDRWEGFRRDVEAAGARLILHDLTLPMPFLRSGSFDGVFSHFALEYISPIGVQQVLREAARLLVPGGLMIIHLTAPGLAMGDTARTSPYDESVLTRLLITAGFEDFEVEQPEDKQIAIVHARGPGRGPDGTEGPAGEAAAREYEADGEIQVAAGFRPRASAGDDDPVVETSVCARVVAVGPDEFEVQSWSWVGARIAAMQRAPHSGPLRIGVDGAVEHRDVWRPEPPMLEPPGDAYVTIEDAAPGHQPGEEWRARGRQVIVERAGDDPDRLRSASGSEDHFLVRRPDPGGSAEPLERDWRDGGTDGIVLSLEDALRPESQPLLRWADSRGAMIYVEPDSWADLEAIGDLPGSDAPVIVVDPRLSGRTEAQADLEVPQEAIASALDAAPALHVALAASTASSTAQLGERYPARILLGEIGDAPPELRETMIRESAENLRYLTERVTLIRLRSTKGTL